MTQDTETDRGLAHISRPVPALKLLFCGASGVMLRQWALISRPLPIGRTVDPDQGVALPADTKASAVHARVRFTADGVELEDAGSKNGTFVNGQPISASQLRDGDVIRIGNSLLLLRLESPELQDAPPEARIVHELFHGSSPAVRALRHTLARAATQEAAVLLLGPTGTGKELAAQAIHALSGRRGPLVRVNSASITASLAESTLFGHVDGAFTSAKRHTGFFREADSGTLLLDEVGDLPAELQPKLLRALEEHAIWPVGARRPEPCDVRLIAATNRDLRLDVQAGRFRADLHARLSALPVNLPPLHTRGEDILPLFQERLKLPERALTARLCEALLLYSWPANVRELINLAEYTRAFASAGGDLDLPLLASRLSPQPAPPGALAVCDDAAAGQRAAKPPAARRESYNQEVLTRLLREHRGVIARVAERLGLSRRQLGRAMEKFGIDPDQYRRGEP